MPGYYIGAFSIITITGIYLLVRGNWPPRRGRTPYCRHCNYNLTGLGSNQCPECGTFLTSRGTVFGHRARSPKTILSGCLCLSPAFLLLVAILRGWNPYPYFPNFLILHDIRSPKSALVGKAWAELDRRNTLQQLTSSQQRELIDACLYRRESSFNNVPGDVANKMNAYLAHSCAQGEFTAQQKTDFLMNIFQNDFRVRSRVAQGDAVPYDEIDWTPAPQDGLAVKVTRGEIFLDGKPTSVGESEVWTRGGSYQSEYGSISCNEVGRHKLTRKVGFELYYCPSGYTGPINDILLHKEQRELQATFEIVNPEPPDYIRHIQDDSLRSTIQRAINVSHLHESPSGGKLEGSIYVDEGNPPPAGVAFAIIVRVQGKEYVIGQLFAPPAGHPAYRHLWRPLDIRYHWVDWDYSGTPFTSCEVILRSDEKIARSTVDLYEMWEGELIYSNVNLFFYPRDGQGKIVGASDE